MKAWVALLLCLVAAPVFAQKIVTAFPSTNASSKTYLIYLHGRIVENLGPRPTDSRFGLYDYPAILDALASKGATVISSQRKPNTNVNEYAGLVVSQIEEAIRSGVPPDHIVVVGFSKGGDIAIHVSSFLRRPQVRFVLLAACWPRPDEPQLRLTGRVLSVYETSDTLAGNSCAPLAQHPEKPQSFEEITISTGRSHGAFYTPMKEWVEPVLDWIH
jgi:hypothetical protein